MLDYDFPSSRWTLYFSLVTPGIDPLLDIPLYTCLLALDFWTVVIVTGAAVAMPTSQLNYQSGFFQQHLQHIYSPYKSQTRPTLRAETFLASVR